MERQANLVNIQAQLNSEAIQSVSAVLEACKSNYFPAFKRCAPPELYLASVVTARCCYPCCEATWKASCFPL